MNSGEGRRRGHATDTRRWKYKLHSERDWSTDTEMSKGWEEPKRKRAWDREVRPGEKGVGGRRKGVEEDHPSPCPQSRSSENPLPAGREGAESFPRVPDALPQPRGLPSQAPERCPLGTGCAAPIDGGGPSWCVISLLRSSLSHSAAASLRLGPRRVVQHLLARTQPPFPPSSRLAGGN